MYHKNIFKTISKKVLKQQTLHELQTKKKQTNK